MSSSIPLLSAEAHARVGRFVRFRLCPSFCRSKNAREDSYLFLVSATSGRLAASLGWACPVWGVFGYLPFIYGLAAAGAVACGSGTRDPLFGDGVVSVRVGAGA